MARHDIIQDDAEQPSDRRRLYAACCFLLMAALAALAYTWSGLTWWTIFAIAVAVSCPIVMGVAWWQGERTRRAVQRALKQLKDFRSHNGETHGP